MPTYRGDLRRPIDLVEKVARIYGYGAIPDDLPGPQRRVREDAEHEPTIRSHRDRNRRWVQISCLLRQRPP